MPSLIECVPNFSEGRRAEVVEEIAQQLEAAAAKASKIPRATRRALRLEIFLRPGVDALQCFLDIRDRVRHAKAQVAFAEVTKGCAG